MAQKICTTHEREPTVEHNLEQISRMPRFQTSGIGQIPEWDRVRVLHPNSNADQTPTNLWCLYQRACSVSTRGAPLYIRGEMGHVYAFARWCTLVFKDCAAQAYVGMGKGMDSVQHTLYPCHT